MAYESLEDLSRSLHLMSKEELLELKDKLDELLENNEKRLNPEEPEYRETDLEEFEFADDMESLAALANDLDKKGFCEAADEIDSFIKAKKDKLEDPGRLMARALRRKFASK